MNFTELFQKYSQHTDKERTHRYGRLYDQWLPCVKNVRTVCLLGVNEFGGGCLLSFQEMFPDAKIVGIDIRTDTLKEEIGRCPEIEVIVGDVYHEETFHRVKSQYPSFDLVIDDCLHYPENQALAFQYWSRLLAPNGLYVIEDVLGIDHLSRLLSKHNDRWQIFLGDNRTVATENSCLFVLRRAEP